MKLYCVTNREQAWYGESIEILIPDTSYPCIPGNASTFDFPVRYEQEVAAPANMPVFLSSRLQIPFIYKITGKKVGIITANASCLTQKHFENTGVPQECPLAIAGMESQAEFRSAISEEKGTLDTEEIENEAIGVAQQMVKNKSDIGSILPECSDLPPYAAAVQSAVNQYSISFR